MDWLLWHCRGREYNKTSLGAGRESSEQQSSEQRASLLDIPDVCACRSRNPGRNSGRDSFYCIYPQQHQLSKKGIRTRHREQVHRLGPPERGSILHGQGTLARPVQPAGDQKRSQVDVRMSERSLVYASACRVSGARCGRFNTHEQESPRLGSPASSTMHTCPSSYAHTP